LLEESTEGIRGLMLGMSMMERYSEARVSMCLRSFTTQERYKARDGPPGPAQKWDILYIGIFSLVNHLH
jgi:hypothetical protein